MNVKDEIEIIDEELDLEYNSYKHNIQIFPDSGTDFASPCNTKIEELDQATSIKSELKGLKKESMPEEEQVNNDVLKSEMCGKNYSFQHSRNGVADQSEQGSKLKSSRNKPLTSVTFDQAIKENCQDYLRCRFCNFTFKNKAELTNHLKTHDKRKFNAQQAHVEPADAVANAVRLPPKTPTPITKSDPFKPKNLGGEQSSLKNDPFYNVEICIQGMDITPYNEPRSFEIDYSALLTLINGSYFSLTQFDRGMRKYISESMYAYYCIIGLWNRVWHITAATKGNNFSADMELKLYLPEMVFPKEMIQYFDGIGNVLDNENIKVDLDIQATLNQVILSGGAMGSFDRIDADTHILYETIPAPIIALLRIQADYLLAHGGNADWDLPPNLQPAAADHVDRPTENLLGWKRAQGLTEEQVRSLQDSEMILDAANLDFGCRNIGGLPINYSLLSTISNYLSASKNPITGKMSEHITGTIGSIAYQLRAESDHNIDRKNITDKMMSLNVVSHLNASISQLIFVYRFRVDRRYDDTYCFTLAQGQVRPQGWIDTKNDIFIYGYAPNWNRRLYASGFSSGKNNVGTLCRAYRTHNMKT